MGLRLPKIVIKEDEQLKKADWLAEMLVRDISFGAELGPGSLEALAEYLEMRGDAQGVATARAALWVYTHNASLKGNI